MGHIFSTFKVHGQKLIKRHFSLTGTLVLLWVSFKPTEHNVLQDDRA